MDLIPLADWLTYLVKIMDLIPLADWLTYLVKIMDLISLADWLTYLVKIMDLIPLAGWLTDLFSGDHGPYPTGWLTYLVKIMDLIPLAGLFSKYHGPDSTEWNVSLHHCKIVFSHNDLNWGFSYIIIVPSTSNFFCDEDGSVTS